MAVLLNATGDSLGIASSPNGTYWAASFWFRPEASSLTGGVLSISDSGGSDYAAWSLNAGVVLLEADEGFTGTGTPASGTWHHVYVSNDGTNLFSGFSAVDSTSYTTASRTSSPVTTPVNLGVGCYLAGDTTYNKNWRIAHVKVWSGNGTIPTAAQLQAERWSARPIYPGAWGWWPLLTTTYGDLSGNGRTLTAVSVGGADGPPVSWGAAPQLYAAAAGRIIGPGQIWPTVTL